MGPDFSASARSATCSTRSSAAWACGGIGAQRAGPRAGGDIAMTADDHARAGGDRRGARADVRGDRDLRALPRQRRRARDADRDLRALRRRRDAAGGHALAVRADRAQRRLRRVRRRGQGAQAAVRALRRPRARGAPAHAARRRPGGHRRRPAHPARRARPRRRGGRAAGRPLRRSSTCASTTRFLRDGDDLVTVVDVPAPRAALGHDAVRSKASTATTSSSRSRPARSRARRSACAAPACRRCSAAAARATCAPSSTCRSRAGSTSEQRKLLEELADSVRPEQLGADESLVGKLRRLLT